jgi:hypothetical protein
MKERERKRVCVCVRDSFVSIEFEFEIMRYSLSLPLSSLIFLSSLSLSFSILSSLSLTHSLLHIAAVVTLRVGSSEREEDPLPGVRSGIQPGPGRSNRGQRGGDTGGIHTRGRTQAGESGGAAFIHVVTPVRSHVG